MSEAIERFTAEHLPTYSRWFSRAQLKKNWANRALIVKYIFFGWLVPFKWLHDWVFELRQWQQFTITADLPQPLSDAALKVIKLTRLWNREKSEIAIELVSHFQDGIDAGRSTEELLKSFGDSKQAAKLMRRAKKRCRPMWWQAWWWASRGVVVFTCFYVLVALWQVLASPTIKTDYLAIINQKAESWGENDKAWPVYREAFREIDFAHMPEWYTADDTDIKQLNHADKVWPEVEKWLDQKQHAISVLREGGKRPGLGFSVWNTDAAYDPEDQKVLTELSGRIPEKASKERVVEPLEKRSLVSTLLPHLNPLRQAVYLLRLDALRAADRGDGATAIADIEAILAMSKHSEEIRFLVNNLVGYAFQKIALSTIHDILAKHPEIWSDEQLVHLAHKISAHQLHPLECWESERYSFLDMMQRLYTDDGNGDGRLTQEGIEALRAINPLLSRDTNGLARLLLLFPEQNEVAGNNWIDSSLQKSSLLRTILLPTANVLTASRKEMIEEYDRWRSTQLAQANNPLWQVDSERTGDSQISSKYWLVDVFLPSNNTITQVMPKHAGYKEGALAGIALELYRRKHGKWPASLDELSPKFLPSVPFDRFTGKPLIYKIVNDRPLIYSVGADKDDDGGVLPKESQEKWMDYYARQSDGFWSDPRSKKMSEICNGDWIIWTLLPEHQTVPKPPVVKKETSPDEMNENEPNSVNNGKKETIQEENTHPDANEGKS